MIQTKEELFLAELGINTKEEIELAYGAKIKITELLKKYETKQLRMDNVIQQHELLLSAICQFTKRNTQKEIQEVEKWIETDFRK
jgi:hypothetical protein